MLTSRGWWFLILVFSLLGAGVLGAMPPLLAIGLTLLIWFVAEWLLFTMRVHVSRHVTLVRELRDERGRVDCLWAGRIFTVQVELRLEGFVGLPHAAVLDWLPSTAEYVSGATHFEGSIHPGQPVQLAYQIHCEVVGRVRFEGVQLRLADYQGFFQHLTFLRNPVEYRVLPGLVDEAGRPSTARRYSLLPPPGTHRLRRPGSGSELLDLRDYMPGDPPRTIAWKVSARRGRLITKEFESEVPIRCTLFVDTSNSVRLGGEKGTAGPPGKNALTRLVEIAAAVAQANSSARDLTGLCLIDETNPAIYRPARTPQHLAHLLKVLADAACLPPTTGHARVEELLPPAHELAQNIYPDLLWQEVNRVPSWLPWWWRLPKHSDRRPRILGRLGRWLFIGMCLLGSWLSGRIGFYVAKSLVKDQMTMLFPDLADHWAEIYPTLSEAIDQVIDGYDVLMLALAPVYCWFFSRLIRALPLFFSFRRRRLARWRKQLAALLSFRHGMAPGGLATFLEDDALLSLHLQRFLSEHHVPCSLPLYDDQGRYLFAAPTKVDVLASALVRTVSRGRDNELYVLLVDLLELDERLDPLLRAVRLALSRHHQVVLVCPLPADGEVVRWRGGRVVTEGQGGTTSPLHHLTTSQPHHPTTSPPRHDWLDAKLREATTARLHRSYRRLLQAFARLGVPVVNAHGGESVKLILDRIDRLRAVRRRR